MSAQPMSINHYENFPVASLLCPAAQRPHVMALYHFARTADDLADEGDVPCAQRLLDLAAYRVDLQAVLEAKQPSKRWFHLFHELFQTILACKAHETSEKAFLRTQVSVHLHELLDAFEKDVQGTASGHRYQSRGELLAYCRLSANPVGRLMLHLFGVDDALSKTQSDAICSALQLINFWQDVSVDVPRGRFYLIDEPMADLVAWARELMHVGAPLSKRIGGRFGFELRLVVQGGLRILDKIAIQGFDTTKQRPKLGAWDGLLVLWRAICM